MGSQESFVEDFKVNKMFDRLIYRASDALGFLFCELAFKTNCRGPFRLAYAAGCWLYAKATDAGIRCGQLVENPRFQLGRGEPLYVKRSR
jgi:hypothetical protein